MAVLAVAVLLGAARAASAEYDIEAAIGARAEYNDNIFLSPENPRDDVILGILPSIHGFYDARFWDWDVSYTLDYRYYIDGTRDNDTTHRLSLTNKTYLIRDVLFLDISDEYRRVSLDTVQDYTQQSLFLNQTDQNELAASPYVRFDLTTHTSGTAGYLYRNIWHKQRSAVNVSEQNGFMDLVDELSPRTRLTAGLKYSRIDADRDLGFDVFDIYAGPRYEYSEGSWAWVILGNSWFSPGQSDQNINGNQPFWDVGISHKFLYYTLLLNAALSYVDDPERVRRREDRYTASVRRETERFFLTMNVDRREYRLVSTKHLQNTRNGIGGAAGYDLTQDLRGIYSLSIDRYEQNETDTYSMRYINVLRLEYEFPATTTMAFEYRFEHGYSPDAVNYNMNNDNNRFILEIRTLF
jgi:hypothetical protein